MDENAGENLRRVMAQQGLSLKQVVERTGLDRRTLSGILDGRNRPHARTLHRLAQGLGVPVSEFFLCPARLLYRHFDALTNPAVEEAVETHPELFVGWKEADFEELHSRFGAGGPLTPEGTIQTVRQMNHRRQLQEKFALLLESTHAGLLGGIVELLYREVVVPDRE